MMHRRSFLSSILVACAAPAIVRADSLMKIMVPRQGIIRFGDEGWSPSGMGFDLGSGDFTVEGWLPAGQGDPFFRHVALVNRFDSGLQGYVDGMLVGADDCRVVSMVKATQSARLGPFEPPFFDELRITRGVARQIATPPASPGTR